MGATPGIENPARLDDGVENAAADAERSKTTFRSIRTDVLFQESVTIG